MSGATRRRVLQHAVGAAVAGASCFTGIQQAAAQVVPGPRVRSEANTTAGRANLVIYRAAVRYMRTLPSANRRSWAYQVSIHNNWCPHGNWCFLPWHREYLLALENVIRGLPQSQVPNASQFAMPYWNWNENRRLPSAFTTPTVGGTSNALYNSTRALAASGSIPLEAVSTTVMESIYTQTSFTSFGSASIVASASQRRRATMGMLEATPHNIVHNTIAGDMATMLSPRDPIFFLHHANIDRIWASWNRQGGVNSTSTAWRNRTFSNNFARSNGTLYSVAIRNISDAAYIYDAYDEAPAPPVEEASFAPASEWIQVATAGPLTGLLRGTGSRVRVANKSRAMLGLPAAIPMAIQGGRRSGRKGEAAVRLIDLASPAIANAPLVRVFVNHPAISPDAAPEGPHYVGTFSFFGTAAQKQALQTVEPSSGQRFSPEDLCITDPGDAAAKAATSVSVELPLTQALQRLEATGKPIGDTLTVQLVPVSLGNTAEQVEIQPKEVEVEFY